MNICPYCGSENKRINVSSLNYLGFGMNLQDSSKFRICNKSKIMLNENGTIYLPNKNAGLLIPRNRR